MATIPHTFAQPDLLELALTHASQKRSEDNERMEFLGDAALDLIIAEELYRRYPDLPEGDLTEMKAGVVSRRTLAKAAHGMGLEEVAQVGGGLQQRALSRAVLANLYEAVLGAVYLDAGLDAARTFALTTLDEYLEAVQSKKNTLSPKQALQEFCQGQWSCLPEYVELEARGPSHARAFLVRVQAAGESFPSAWGRTLKEAEHWAASEALLVLEERRPA
ncbi:ribonuclease III [Candidatus Woesearchaeota archaeon]|jgi:ribonuclease-3|nr:ribonuclease III [Candidatus Woesearchaeota archaeon]MDP6738980.1 ribonuclease III [Planctomycetota bacterium]MDP6938457.1 ribonuclease III [Planctomycetota bacterium]